MVQGTNFPPIPQGKGVKKIMPLCNQLLMSKIKQHPLSKRRENNMGKS